MFVVLLWCVCLMNEVVDVIEGIRYKCLGGWLDIVVSEFVFGI